MTGLSTNVVLSTVAEAFDQSIGDLVGPNRSRVFVIPRQVAYAMFRQHTDFSLPEIGLRVGGRDHTTVMHGLTAIDKRRKLDGDLDAKVRLISDTLEGQRLPRFVRSGALEFKSSREVAPC